MNVPEIFESEYRFCLILWRCEPIASAKLAATCKEELGWSRTTTYTVIKRLSERGVVKNENSVVTSLFSKEEIQIAKVDEVVDKVFEGSASALISAFTKKRNLSEEDIKELKRIIGD